MLVQPFIAIKVEAVSSSTFYTQQSIQTYDKSGTAKALCPPIGSTSNVPAGGSDAEIAFKFLINNGLTANQAAGIVGNLMAETGGGTFDLNPTALNSIGAYGIVQWMGGRKSSLMQKPNYTSLETQINFMWEELNGPYNYVLSALKASSTIPEAAKIINEKYEIPCVPGRSGRGCDSENSARTQNAQKAYDAFSGITSEAGTATSLNCGGSTPGATVNASGYAFPILLPKADVSNGYGWPCRTASPYCHHDGTAALDLARKGLDDSTAGTPVVAVFNGKIARINPNYMGTGCQSFQFFGDDGYYYWYGHIRTDSKTPAIGAAVSAGTYLGKVGERRCTGNGSYPHLHIDRGLPKGHAGGMTSFRDPAFISIINDLYTTLQ